MPGYAFNGLFAVAGSTAILAIVIGSRRVAGMAVVRIAFVFQKPQKNPADASLQGFPIMVRVEGLEPPHLSIPEPKSGVSTNSTTPA